MKLYLVQHGEACAKDVNPERPVTDQDREDVERLTEFLGQAGIQVDRVIHSDDLRAAQTADCLAKAVAPVLELETNGRINPRDDPKGIDWEKETGGKDALVVGHLPYPARLVSNLLIEDPDKAVTAFLPGSILCLESDRDGRWQINWMTRPELLRHD